MPAISLPLPVWGIDVLSQETALPSGCVRHAVNVVIDRYGQVRRRFGFQWLQRGRWSTLFDLHGTLIAQKGRELWRIHPSDLTQKPIATLDSSTPIDCTVYNQNLYFVQHHALWRMQAKDDMAQRAGVASATMRPHIEASAQGQWPKGRYAVALSWVDSQSGEESPAVMLGHISIDTDYGGLLLRALPLHAHRRWRVYVTTPHGQLLYLAESFDAHWPQYHVGTYPKGAVCSTLHRQLMCGGQLVRGFKGRLLVARANVLHYSDALAPHLTQPAHAFVQFASDIRFMEPVAGGVFVGQSDGVYFLAGDDPEQWQLQRVSECAPLARSSRVMDSARAGLQGQGLCALWLSQQGHMAGMADGAVLPLNANRIRCPMYASNASGKSALIDYDGVSQFITLSQSRMPTGAALAHDSSPTQGIAP